MIGYKVMKLEDGKIVSGANSRVKFTPKKGKVMKMDGNGIYLTPHKDYALDYYSGLADQEVLLTLEFDPDTIITGNLEDKEPEISVPEVKILDIEEVLDESIFTKMLGTLKEKKYVVNYNLLYEATLNDFNIDKKDLKDLNDMTLTEVFKAIDMSIHRNNPTFVREVIEPITEYMRTFLEAPTHLDQLAQFICKHVMLYDERLYEEIDMIFDTYDKIYTCMATNNSREDIYDVIKDNLPIIEDWEHDYIDGKLQYINRYEPNESYILEVNDFVDLVLFEKDTICEIFLEVSGDRKLIYDEVIRHCKYIPSIIDNMPFEYQRCN